MPLPLSWSGILGIFEQPAFERLIIPTGSRAHYAGKQPNASIQQHQRGRLAARKDDIADADFLDLTAFENPLVKTLKPPA
jgi:hypothetical protein